MNEPVICMRCIHLKAQRGGKGYTCGHRLSVDLVTGVQLPARDARASSGQCQAAGKLFEAGYNGLYKIEK